MMHGWGWGEGLGARYGEGRGKDTFGQAVRGEGERGVNVV